MYVPHRPSVLRRPLRASEPKANLENYEKEYEKEQQRLASKAAAQRETETRFIKSFYGTEEEKRSGWEATQRELQQHAQSRQAAMRAERAREDSWLSQPQQVYVDTRRPWTANSATYYLLPQEEEEARRRLQREDAEQNRLMAFSRAYQQEQDRKQEAEALRSTIQSEDAWFNRGAVSERWIPPEHRIKHRVVATPEFASRPAPYHCEDVPFIGGAGAAGRPGTAPGEAGYGEAAPRQPSARRSAFWERESGQGAKAALTHDVHSEAEQAQRQQRAQQQQAQAVQAQTQQATAQQQQCSKYPWSWDA